MSIQDVINNDLIQEESSVWLLKQHSKFGYSDGVESERYLESVFKAAKDLSSNSSELESYIKDWPSEYHLTVKRAQLFAGFDFDPSLKVLEVGCGCGAITRYLGETFTDVVSIEGNIKRARLARLRTRGLGGVSIICAPFQEINFLEKFDIIFCIGVYEYSASFVVGEDPYDSVLNYFSDMLTPNGIVVIAIENQFGLKYFNSAREDHTGSMFEGLEGYHASGNRVKTFGKYELEDNLRKYFTNIKYYYPYPDYKLPSCIISDDFLSSGHAGELVSQIRSRDYSGKLKSLWHESLVSLELSKNGMLPFFSNSFLVFAGKSKIEGVKFDQLAIMASSQRAEKFRTETRIYNDKNDKIEVSKKTLSGDHMVAVGKLVLIESRSSWKDSYSLQTVLYRNCMSNEMKLVDMFMPCRAWVDYLEGVAEYENGDKYLGGEYIDCIFSNVYLSLDGVSVIDNEWVWKEKIKLNVVVIRSVFTFLCRIENAGRLSSALRLRSFKRLIFIIAECIGVKLNNSDFADFIKLESEFQSLVYASEKKRSALMLQWVLFDRPSFYYFRALRNFGGKLNLHIKRLIARLYRKI
ncbi:MAG TPA: class I SAM-dependent methyltransferase [Gammaproteobacteria bacterium]|nr:class I SAM-dependent methyltransferase [Gammaproteobacteria bacterium]